MQDNSRGAESNANLAVLQKQFRPIWVVRCWAVVLQSTLYVSRYFPTAAVANNIEAVQAA